MNEKIYARQYYLNKMRGFYDSDLIKVITGIRRCGKSCFLLSVMNDLEQRGILPKDIIYINLDKRNYKSVKTPEALEKAIDALVQDDDFKYLFIDEIQNVGGFEEIVNSYREDGGFSLFITGSNSYLLSGELVTKLTGRYVELEMFPLNFYEYLEMKKFLGKNISGNRMEEFTEYIRMGGFPKTLEFDDENDKALYVSSVIGQIFEKDIKKHKDIRNKIVFEKIMSYLINNFGATVSLSNLLNYFHNEEHIPIKAETLHNYIRVLENAKIIYRCSRFDVKSKKSLQGEQKYYLADLSIYFSRNVDARINYGSVLENIMYTYLRSKNYQVSVGRIGKLECDFIVRKNMEYQYVQVAMTLMEPKTEEREYKPFQYIHDNYPKYIFTLDQLLQKRDGILHVNMVDFISDDREL